MAYITNDGARLIERARTEGKSIVFGSVRMNTVYKSDPTSLVQKSDEWFGENHGSVVGCISHVSVNEVSEVCDSKLAVQCNDNSESWKSLGIYAHLDGEVDEILFACESIENGEYKDVTIVELPVTLDGVVADFGLSEGGSGGGGGSEAPANMMTTNSAQEGLSGMKTWSRQSFLRDSSIENPVQYDLMNETKLHIGDLDGGYFEGRPGAYPISLSNTQSYYNGTDWVNGRLSMASLSHTGKLTLDSGDKFDEGEHAFYNEGSITISPNEITYRNESEQVSKTTWADIIHAANRPAPVILSDLGVVNTISDAISLWGELIPASGSLTHDGIVFNFDASKHLSSVHPAEGIATISVRVFDSGISGNEVGIVNGVCDSKHSLSFETPVALADSYLLMWSIVQA